ncbi:hypothetical protein DFH27DRAFT_248139 [Peziza echinospora]|nr:hypothetical protein DFH27DRAFT_248139 [Peziza echinospora]
MLACVIIIWFFSLFFLIIHYILLRTYICTFLSCSPYYFFCFCFLRITEIIKPTIYIPIHLLLLYSLFSFYLQLTLLVGCRYI